jgi:lipoate-protein ligase A
MGQAVTPAGVDPVSGGGPRVRLIDTDIGRPHLTTAIDEAILESRLAGSCPDTVHLYRRVPASVSIGYFQASSSVVDLDACRRDGVPVVRRVSGGGAIYTDDKQLVYALVYAPPEPMTAREGFGMACAAIVRALEGLGVVGARASGVNDVLVGNAKVSGNAQAIRRGVHLIHGTVLVDADLDAMFTYLRPQVQKLRAHALDRPEARVTTLATVLGISPSMADVKRAVAGELAASVGRPLEVGTLSPGELEMAQTLERERYTTDEWNLKR